MDRIIEVYRGNYWLPAFHLLCLATLVYAGLTIRKHAWPSICLILSILLNCGHFLWWQFAVIPALLASSGVSDTARTYLYIANSLTLSSAILLYVAIFGWRSGSAARGRAIPCAGGPAPHNSLL